MPRCWVIPFNAMKSPMLSCFVPLPCAWRFGSSRFYCQAQNGMKKMQAIEFFKGRTVLIASQHNKDVAMAPFIREKLKCQIFYPSHYDTDALGTFSGEIERKGEVVDVLREKCERAMDMYQLDLAIASEGSFGPHPAAFFAYADEEWVMMKDRKNDWEFVERVISLSTNFDAAYCDGPQGIESFAKKVKFPEHALIARVGQHDFSMMTKGIRDWDDLMKICIPIIESHGKVYIETDMRAMNNPTRMQVIGEAAEKLIKRILSQCPECNFPGFGVSQAVSGLPCRLCNRPTNSTLKIVHACRHCEYSNDVFYPHNKKDEDPMYCDFCNP